MVLRILQNKKMKKINFLITFRINDLDSSIYISQLN